MNKIGSSVVKFEEFFTEKHKEDLFEILDAYPKKRSIIINYDDLEMFDSDLADLLIEKPEEIIRAEEEAKRAEEAARIVAEQQAQAQQEAMLQPCIAQYQSAQGLVDGIEDEERCRAGRHAVVAEVVGQMGTAEGNGKQVEVPAEADSPQPLPATEPNASGQSYAASHSPRQVFCFVHLCVQGHAEQEVGYSSGPDCQYPPLSAQRKAEC